MIPTRAKRLTVLLLPAIFAAGCLQASINPLFTPDDARFDDGIVGKWRCGSDTWTITRATVEKDAKEYAGRSYAEIEIAGGDDVLKMVALVGRLGNADFATFMPDDIRGTRNSFFDAHVVGASTFGRILIEPNRIRLAMLDDQWVRDAIEKHRAGGLTLSSFTRVLTSPTKDLQQFARAHANDDKAFSTTLVLVRDLPGADIESSHCGNGK